jgi:SAM-dependent methyltransferase
VDLAAGTGKMTKLLAATGADVIAVEPLARMLTVLTAKVHAARAVAATAQRIALSSSVADAVIAAQAFHWFDSPESLSEIHRVLKRGASLGLVWNRRALDQALQRAISEVLEPHRGDAPSHTTGRWRVALEGEDRFAAGAEAHFPTAQLVDRSGFLARCVSVSFVANLPRTTRDRVVDALEELVEDEREPITLRYVTDCYCFERRP